eukprot:gnl/MRDRNA2_/MRDRNA2_29371_c0_seq1.p1 gnl/MRDRNA2_/MRDRNA2_29371_c0~~gnl/MRDRNA2_/MRDRNA2_29371_c0_seq1.p1  ORF type:complete len:231 (+),score=54.22 gnl/MRDRNA2_/MRDRNA2_29371_c0_seq1:101-793(+)
MEGCRVYVGNLDWRITWQNLKDHMKQAGHVNFVDLFEGPDGRSKGCATIEYGNPMDAQKAINGLNDTQLGERLIFVRQDVKPERANKGGGKGWGGGGGGFGGKGGFGGFGGGGGGMSMTQMNPMFQKMQFGGKGKGKGKKGSVIENGPDCAVWIGNLPSAIGWQDLKAHFDQAGKTTWVENLAQKNKGKSKGVGGVAYKTPQEAQNAISMLNGTVLAGQVLQVDRWVKRD